MQQSKVIKHCSIVLLLFALFPFFQSFEFTFLNCNENLLIPSITLLFQRVHYIFQDIFESKQLETYGPHTLHNTELGLHKNEFEYNIEFWLKNFDNGSHNIEYGLQTSLNNSELFEITKSYHSSFVCETEAQFESHTSKCYISLCKIIKCYSFYGLVM